MYWIHHTHQENNEFIQIRSITTENAKDMHISEKRTLCVLKMLGEQSSMMQKPYLCIWILNQRDVLRH